MIITGGAPVTLTFGIVLLTGINIYASYMVDGTDGASTPLAIVSAQAAVGIALSRVPILGSHRPTVSRLSGNVGFMGGMGNIDTGSE